MPNQRPEPRPQGPARRGRRDVRRRACALARVSLPLALLLAVSLAAQARNTGISSADMLDMQPGSCNGLDCHGLANEGVFVSIEGPAALEPGEAAVYTATLLDVVEGSGARQMGAGLNVAAFLDGILTDETDAILSVAVPPVCHSVPCLRITSAPEATGQVTHNFAWQLFPGVFSHDFTVTAPDAPGELELVVAMNGFNGNMLQTGDHWNASSLVVQVPEPDPTSAAAAALVALAALAALRRSTR